MGIKKVLISLSRRGRGAWTTTGSEKMSSIPAADDVDLSYQVADGKGMPQVGESYTDTDMKRSITHGYPLKMCVIMGTLLILFIVKFTVFASFEGADSPKCRSIYMFPSYARIDGFDLRYTPLAQKYHLYLYREQNMDKEPINNEGVHLDGIPVLFIPGNAGSFKQVRSIAASCARTYFRDRETINNPNAKNLDFFTADFNEDFTAFHGRTMLDQAEYLNDAIRYILSLYRSTESQPSPSPTSVIVIGHSMGGIVARILPTLKNHLDGSLRSFITLSSPHAAAPVTFDGDILKIYARINDFWREQMQDKDSFMSQHVSLISITGGILDMMLPADYTAVEDVLPLENGFTTYSSTIPNVWTPIDHLAVVWCDQLRATIAKVLLETVDVTTPCKVRPLDERMKISRNMLLSGFENYTSQDLTAGNSSSSVQIVDAQKTHSSNSSDFRSMGKLIVTEKNLEDLPRYNKISLPQKEGKLNFVALSSQKKINILFCKIHKNSLITNSPQEHSHDDCFSLANEMKDVPASMKTTSHASDSSLGNDIQPFKMMSIGGLFLSNYDYIVIEKPLKVDLGKEGFFICELTDNKSEIHLSVSPLRIGTLGFEHIISDALSQTLVFTNLWDALLSYQVQTSLISDIQGELPFQPFVRQWIEDPFESKWHVNISDGKLNINMHNVAPFIPLEETHDKSLKLTFTAPPGVNLKFKIQINWKLTLKMLFIRYRLVMLSFPVSIISFVMAYQFNHYHKTNFYPDFQTALARILKSYWMQTFFVLLLLSPIVNTRVIQRLLYALDPISLNRPFLLDKQHMHTNFYFLGIRSWFLSGLSIFFGLISIAALFLVSEIFAMIEKAVKCIKVKVSSNSRNKSESTNSKTATPWGLRLFACLALICAVFFYIPYQLASAISLLIQIATCLNVLSRSDELKSVNYMNLRNYNFSIFLLLLFVVCINSPIIIVFLHNVAIGWETPFRSHHNFLAIAPIIFLVNSNSALKIPKFKARRKYERATTVLLLAYLGTFSLLYGARNLYWIHHLVNITSAWFLYGVLIPGHSRK